MTVEIFYTFTPAAYSGEAPAREFYWDDVLQQGGLRDVGTHKARFVKRPADADGVYWVDTKEELLEIVELHKSVHNRT